MTTETVSTQRKTTTNSRELNAIAGYFRSGGLNVAVRNEKESSYLKISPVNEKSELIVRQYLDNIFNIRVRINDKDVVTSSARNLQEALDTSILLFQRVINCNLGGNWFGAINE